MPVAAASTQATKFRSRSTRRIMTTFPPAAERQCVCQLPRRLGSLSTSCIPGRALKFSATRNSRRNPVYSQEPCVVVQQIADGLLKLQRTVDALRRLLDDGHVRFLQFSSYKLPFPDAAQTIGARLTRHEAGANLRSPVTHGASKGGVAPASSEAWAAIFPVAVLPVISFLFLKFASPQK